MTNTCAWIISLMGLAIVALAGVAWWAKRNTSPPPAGWQPPAPPKDE